VTGESSGERPIFAGDARLTSVRPRLSWMLLLVLALLLAALVAAILTARANRPAPEPPMLAPIVVFSPMELEPVVVLALAPATRAKAAAKPKRIPVSVTMYCLTGTTRTGSIARKGIAAADPRVFPLGRHVELFVGHRRLGRFLIDDTGGGVRGRTLDVWTPSCDEAEAFGRRRGSAAIVSGPAR
jgi:3D (Asp-Asp-Asp) domain-containing protein